MISLVDTHTHFHFPEFDPDRDEAVLRARSEGVKYFINIGTDVPSSEKSLAFALKYPDFFASAGIHPHDAKEARDEDFKAIEPMLLQKRMVAIGEVGLDFYRDHSPAPIQIQVFEKFLQLQLKIKKPLVIHCRDAYEKMAQVLQAFKQGPYEGVMHCFSSTKEVMFRFLDLGFHISFAGPLTYKKNVELREACRACPADRLLLETDAPFLPPESFRGKRNESAYLIHTAKKAAEIKEMSPGDLGAQTTANAIKLFNLC